jgi:protein O-GlcNAc transferase
MEAQKNGVDPKRIIMTQKASKQEHINRCFLADLALDNPMTNGHTTTCDLLWSGCPVITFPITDNMPSRVAASICSALGIADEAVCTSYTEYSRRAKDLANGTLAIISKAEQASYHALPAHIRDRPHGSPRLKLFRHKVEQNRSSAPLFQTTRWVKQFEQGLVEAYRLFACEKKIENIFVNRLEQKR